jgi:hypothetical protein
MPEARSPGLVLSDPSKAELPISRVRQELCPLVDNIERAPGGKIAITVGEQVAAYLVAPDKLAELEEEAAAPGRTRPSIVGSIEIVGDRDEMLRQLDEEEERSIQAPTSGGGGVPGRGRGPHRRAAHARGARARCARPRAGRGALHARGGRPRAAARLLERPRLRARAARHRRERGAGTGAARARAAQPAAPGRGRAQR